MFDASEQITGLVLHAAGKIEEAVDRENDRLDEQIKKLEDMDDDDLERLRERRLAALKKKQVQAMEFRQRGHGEYREVSDTKEFFTECKKSPRVVVAFYRGTTWRSQIVDKHLRLLAPKHIETKFLRVDAEKHPFLCERLHIYMLPSIVLIKNGKTEHTIIGFDEMGGDDDFPTETLEFVLGHHGVIEHDGPAPESPTAVRKVKQIAKPTIRQTHIDDDDDEFWNDF